MAGAQRLEARPQLSGRRAVTKTLQELMSAPGEAALPPRGLAHLPLQLLDSKLGGLVRSLPGGSRREHISRKAELHGSAPERWRILGSAFPFDINMHEWLVFALIDKSGKL